jgi:hypothetical protein
VDEDGKTANTTASVLIWEVHGLLQALPCHDDQSAEPHGDAFPNIAIYTAQLRAFNVHGTRYCIPHVQQIRTVI